MYRRLPLSPASFSSKNFKYSSIASKDVVALRGEGDRERERERERFRDDNNNPRGDGDRERFLLVLGDFLDDVSLTLDFGDGNVFEGEGGGDVANASRIAKSMFLF